MRSKNSKNNEIVINCLLELLADPEIFVRKAALTSLDLGENIPKLLRGRVVVSLLKFCKESQPGTELALIGRDLKNMSEHYDIGKVVPTENRSDIAKLVLDLDTNNKLYISCEVQKNSDDWGGNEYNWTNIYPKYQNFSIAYLFKYLISVSKIKCPTCKSELKAMNKQHINSKKHKEALRKVGIDSSQDPALELL